MNFSLPTPQLFFTLRFSIFALEPRQTKAQNLDPNFSTKDKIRILGGESLKGGKRKILLS
jgi:hypothetical protein